MTHFPAKLLLFGEYTVIQGSEALAVTFRRYFGNWAFDSSATKNQQKNLLKWNSYLSALQTEEKQLFEIDIDAFEKDLEKGLIFQSTIPTGYGVGSSGALCAGLYSKYGMDKKKDDLNWLKKGFAQLEDFFHGASSGIDPLVSFLDQPLQIYADKTLQIVSLPDTSDQQFTLFLLDTEKSRSTGPLVEIYLENCKQPDFLNRCQQELTGATNKAIKAFLQAEEELLFQEFRNISTIQYELFQPMIPEHCRAIWEKGLSSNAFLLKLCGAGGGGFLLGISSNFEKTKEELMDWKIERIE